MSIASTSTSKRWIARRVRRGAVVIGGRVFRPARDGVPYAGHLDGHRCLFRRGVGLDEKSTTIVTLWGVWDSDEREYFDDRGPHCVDGRFPFVVWYTTGEDRP